jgi:4-amino-4-deoxy-L-arabinose transferase-like glycosyltransferase
VQPNISSSFYRSWITDCIGLVAVLSLFYFFYLGHYPLFTPDEGRYSEVAREMVVTGDYITPRVNGVAFLDKPILYYWLQSLAILLFGIKEWALRFFPAMLGMFGCVMTYVCGRRLFDRRTGIFSALILATSPLYFGGSHYANLDLEVAVFISCTLLCFITAIQSHGKARSIFLFAAYVFSALAMLTKGLIGVAFPSLIAGSWMLLQGRLALLKNIHLLAGILLFIAIVLPWYVLVQKANPEFLHFFFVTQHVTRFLSGAEFNNKTAVWFYLPIIVGGFFPWTIFLVQSMAKQIKEANPVGVYLLLWAGIITLFFSIPHSKLIGYILPVFPALALLTGNYLAEASRKAKKIFLLFTILLAFSTAGLITLMCYANYLNRNTAKPITTALQTILKSDDEVVNYFKFYHDVPIYLERRITLVANWHSPTIPQTDNWVRELWYGMAFQRTDDWLIEEKEFWQRWNSKKRLFVFVNDNYLHQFLLHTKHYFKLAQHNDIILLSNQATTLAKNP